MGTKKSDPQRSEALSLEQYRQVVEEAHEGIWIIDQEARTLYANGSMARMLGYAPEEMAGRSAYDFLFEEDREEDDRVFHEILLAEGRPERTFRYRRRDGSELWARTSISLLREPDGSLRAVVGMLKDVTDQRREKAELEEVRQRLQGLFDHAPVGQALFEAEPPFRVVSHNRLYQECWDEPFRSRGVVGLGVAEYVPEAEGAGVLQVFREVTATGEPRTLYEFPLDGLQRGRSYWHWHLSPIIRDGRVALLAHTLIEVTEAVRAAAELGRRVAELGAQLHHELDTLQSIIDNIPVMLVFYDTEGHFGMVNRAFEKLIGWGSADLKQMDLMAAAYPDPELRAKVWEFMAGPLPGWRDFIITTREGRKVETAWANVRLADGSQIGIGIDISERKRAEAELRHGGERLKLALEVSQAGVFEYGLTEEPTTHQDPRFGEILGLSLERIPQGRRFRRWLLLITQPEDRRRLERALETLESGEAQAVSEDVALRCRGGRYVPVNLQACALTGEEGGSPLSVVGVIRDLSERRRIEHDLEEGRVVAEQRAQELQRLTLELTESEERERRRVARVLHDELQQFLAAAKLKLGGLEAFSKAELLQVAGEVTELMDLAIGVSRSLSSELSPSVLYTAGLVAGLAWLGDWMERQHQLSVEVRAATEAEPQSGGVKIFLFQAARELLFNVVKHSGTLRARLTLSRKGQDLLVLSVADRGRGIEPATPQPHGTRTGFGLMSISERVLLLGGQLAIESDRQRGTRITVSVPDRVMWSDSARGPQAAWEPTARPGRSSKGSDKTHPIRVLVADDHAVVREGFASLLARSGDLEVVALASDGEMAVRLAQALRPDVVLMDVTMPKVNGIEATRRIVETHPDIRVVGLSIHDEKETRQAMLDAGAVEYLTKDGPAEALLGAIYRRSRDADSAE